VNVTPQIVTVPGFFLFRLTKQSWPLSVYLLDRSDRHSHPSTLTLPPTISRLELPPQLTRFRDTFQGVRPSCSSPNSSYVTAVIPTSFRTATSLFSTRRASVIKPPPPPFCILLPLKIEMSPPKLSRFVAFATLSLLSLAWKKDTPPNRPLQKAIGEGQLHRLAQPGIGRPFLKPKTVTSLTPS